MPISTSGLIEAIQRVLGPGPDRLPTFLLTDELVRRHEPALARAVMEQRYQEEAAVSRTRLTAAETADGLIRVAPPLMMDPARPSNDVGVAIRYLQNFDPPTHDPATGDRNFMAFQVFAAPNYIPSKATRPPATPPTSITAIGEPAAMDAEYAALVAELGLNSAAVDLETFKALVPRLGLQVYQRAEVQEYLHHLYKIPVGDLTPNVTWGWRPLRAIDRRTGSRDVNFNGRLQRGAETYHKPIPYPVLLTVKAIHDACPSAGFFVSDDFTGEAIPDPFLLVEIASEQYIVERWDEPAFRAKG